MDRGDMLAIASEEHLSLVWHTAGLARAPFAPTTVPVIPGCFIEVVFLQMARDS